jgi:2-desacetyl-2-hydroxyethyl bacteriochlorophyllide A dehydrogenase
MTGTVVDGQALVVRGPHDVVVEQRGYSSPGPGQVLVKPQFVGVCGTDLEIINGDLDPAYVRYPVVLGHEWSGTVLEVGADVSGINVGDPVVVEGILACSQCAECRAGKTNLCANYDELGFTVDGAAGPAVVAPAALTHRLSTDVALDVAALVEPAAVVLRGLRDLEIVPGARALVIGDGTVALLAAQLLRMWSPSLVVVSGRRAAQAALATAIGADKFTVDAPEPRSFDIVIEAAGSTSAVETALEAAAKGAKILLLGISGHGNAAKLYVDEVVNNDLTIRGSFSYTATAWAETVRLLNAGSFDPHPLITHRYRLDDYQAAFESLASTAGDQPRGKILFDLQSAG